MTTPANKRSVSRLSTKDNKKDEPILISDMKARRLPIKSEMKPLPKSDVFHRTSISFEDGESKEMKTEIERMQTSIMILNKQILIKDEDMQEQYSKYQASIKSLENTNKIKDDKIRLLEAKLAEQQAAGKELLDKNHSLEQNTQRLFDSNNFHTMQIKD